MKNNKLYSIWSKPILLFIVILFGLLAALLATGILHFIARVALCIPLITIAYFIIKRR